SGSSNVRPDVPQGRKPKSHRPRAPPPVGSLTAATLRRPDGEDDMALMDDLMKQGGGILEFAQKNPQAVAAVVALLSTRQTSVGGSGGLGGLIGQFQRAGLGDVMSSWISNGPNPPIPAPPGSQAPRDHPPAR